MKPARWLPLILCLCLCQFAPLATLHPAPAQANQAPRQTESRFQLPETNEGLPGAGPVRRADWFRKLWVDRRSAWAERIEEDQGAVVFLGDSITQGWGDDIGGAFPGMKAANRGISGDTSRGVLIRLEEDVLALNPAAVVLLIGTNDLADDADPETIAGNVKLILSQLKEHDPQMPIILCKVFPSSPSKDRSPGQIRKLNELYAAAVKGDPQIILVETWRLFANQQGNASPEEFPDLLHPNDAGYTKWAGAIRPILATHGFVETAPDDFKPEPGFESLFNGRDLTGWGYRPSSQADIETRRKWHERDPNAPPWPLITEPQNFDGQTRTPDGRYLARNGRLIVTTPPEGRKIQQLWTQREFPEHFILILEFRATPYADSGIFIRKPQLQCRDYLLAGPYDQLVRYQPQQWNEIVVTVRDGVAEATCNGEILEANLQVPETGPIGLEGDRGQMEYRRIRIKTLAGP